MKPQPELVKRVIQFGPFELQVDTGELRKNGIRLKLQGKSFHILQALLERPGEVVTREELKGRLWPSDTFVDFESGLNTAANRLRIALGDSAENPRFIETVARTGYRFIGTIAEIAAPPVEALVPNAPAPPVPAARRRLPWVVASLVLMVALGSLPPGLFCAGRPFSLLSARSLTAGVSSPARGLLRMAKPSSTALNGTAMRTASFSPIP